MILEDKTIKKKIRTGIIDIYPTPRIEQFQPSSLDLRLDYKFKTYKTHQLATIDTKNKHLDLNNYVEETILKYKHEPYIIQPNQFILAQTLECVGIPDDVTAIVEGRSSFGRLGLAIHITAGYIDPGFKGNITLEIKNLNNIPIAIYPEQRICQIVFYQMNDSSEKPYNNKYQGQNTPTVSKITEE